MRFITEFELEYPYTLFQMENLKFSLQEGLGNKIAESFQWKEIGTTTINGPVKYKASIEIEAFPMDKWIEFRDNIIAESRKGRSNRTNNIIKMIEELESHGKEHYEQSKTTK
jgi:hypothetical protein